MLFPTKEYCIDDDEIDNILNDQEQLSSYDSYVVEQLKNQAAKFPNVIRVSYFRVPRKKC